MIRRTLAVLCLVTLSVGVPVGVAHAGDVACGELHESAQLTHDLTCDIRIMGPDITLDLNGFTVNGTISAGRHWSDTPLPGEEPVTNAVVRNGKARMNLECQRTAGRLIAKLKSNERAVGFRIDAEDRRNSLDVRIGECEGHTSRSCSRARTTRRL